MRKIGLLSGKGGVGKTSTAINLGAALNNYGKDVIIVEGNLTTPNVGLHLGVPTVPVNVHDVLKGNNKINEALYKHPSGLQFIPGSLSINDLTGMDLKRMSQVSNLDADYVLMDGAAGLGGEAMQVLDHCDDLMIVTNAEMPAITDALKTIKLAEEMNKNVMGVVVTRSKGDDLDVSIKNIEALLERPVLAVIPEDDTMREALTLRDAVVHTHPKSNAARGYLKLGANLAGIAYVQERPESWARKLWKLIWEI
jgi:septum site-determining protein MinD